MENIELNTVEVTEPKEEDLAQILKLLSQESGLPKGTVEEIFNLGRRTERREIFERGMSRKKAKKEKVKKDPLTVQFMRKLGYEKVDKKPKEKKEEKTK